MLPFDCLTSWMVISSGQEQFQGFSWSFRVSWEQTKCVLTHVVVCWNSSDAFTVCMSSCWVSPLDAWAPWAGLKENLSAGCVTGPGVSGHLGRGKPRDPAWSNTGNNQPMWTVPTNNMADMLCLPAELVPGQRQYSEVWHHSEVFCWDSSDQVTVQVEFF